METVSSAAQPAGIKQERSSFFMWLIHSEAHGSPVGIAVAIATTVLIPDLLPLLASSTIMLTTLLSFRLIFLLIVVGNCSHLWKCVFHSLAGLFRMPVTLRHNLFLFEELAWRMPFFMWIGLLAKLPACYLWGDFSVPIVYSRLVIPNWASFPLIFRKCPVLSPFIYWKVKERVSLLSDKTR